jgi:hypothetical protein
MNRLALIIAALCLCWSPALADECTVFAGGTIHLPEGPRDGFTVVVNESRIVDVGSQIPELELTSETTARWGERRCGAVVLAPGQVLTAGLVQVGGQLGLVEVWGEASTRHADAGGHPVRAAHDVADSYDPMSVAIPVTRREGITSAVVEPSGGMVAGQGAWVDLAGARQSEAVARHGVAMFASLSSPSRGEGIRRIRELLDDARAYAADRHGYQRNESRAYVAGRLELEALQPVVRGEQPLVIGADRAADIEALIRFAAAEEIRLVIAGGAEAWMHADALAAARIPVLVNPLGQDPSSFDKLQARHDGPTLLSEAGVQVLISNRSGLFARHLRWLAGNAVREGMDHTEAIRAITSVPAAVFGMADRGEISRGARADLVVWSGDPLEISTRTLQVMIDGRFVDLRSRQTELLERYREMPGLPLPGLSLPTQ